MTIHKSQGSEYDEVAIVLPAAESPILSRELLYTALTRAKKSAHMFSSKISLEHALQTRVVRRSGLSYAIQSRLQSKS
jgi:exodeoxyribonuclease V alpha subunit